jgi:GDPmannose 4,6-dehydratase
VETLLGDASKARDKLGWQPEITVQEMCREMVEEDLKQARRMRLLRDHGYEESITTNHQRIQGNRSGLP